MMARVGILAALLLCSCRSEPTHFVTVDLATDYVARVDFTEIEVTLRSVDEDSALVRTATAAARDYVRPIRVTQFDDTPEGAYLVTVALLRGSDIVGGRRFQIYASGGYILSARIDAACANIECPREAGGAATECFDGMCVPPDCLTPADCGVAECTVDTDCPASSVSCLEPACVLGSCRLSEVADACAPGEYCRASSGCTPRGSATDAGMDAGVDAGSDDVGDVPTCGEGATQSVVREAINAARTSNGLATLPCDPVVEAVALRQAQYMCDRNVATTTSADGRTIEQQLQDAGVDFEQALPIVRNGGTTEQIANAYANGIPGTAPEIARIGVGVGEGPCPSDYWLAINLR